MKSVIFAGLGALALVGAASPGLSTAPAVPIYLLSMQIRDGERFVGSPKLKIAADEPARIEIGETPGDHYNMTMTVTAQAGETVLVRSKIDVVSGGIHQALSPNMVVALNKSSAIAFGVESATSKPVRIDFTVTKTS